MCILFFLSTAHVLYYCSIVRWTCCDWSLIIRTCFPSVLWHCWLGHLTTRLRYDLYCVWWDVKPFSVSVSMNHIVNTWLSAKFESGLHSQHCGMIAVHFLILSNLKVDCRRSTLLKVTHSAGWKPQWLQRSWSEMAQHKGALVLCLLFPQFSEHPFKELILVFLSHCRLSNVHWRRNCFA